MSCKVKACENHSVIAFNTKVKGFIGEEIVNLCEKHAENLYQVELKLKNGGRIEPLKAHCFD